MALSLIIAPAWRMLDVAQILIGDDSQPLSNQYPGFAGLFTFEAGMDVLLILAALVLNYLFYTRKKSFPTLLVIFAAITVLYRMVVTGIIHTMFPDSIVSQSIRYLLSNLVWAASLAYYLLLDPEVKTRFQN